MPFTHHKTGHLTGHLTGRLAILAGVAAISVALAAPAFASPVPPSITSTQATFTVPSGSSSTWTLNLWWQGTRVGTASATSGTITVSVPTETPCTFQADVSFVTKAGGQSSYYSGSRRTLPTCGGGSPPPTSTIAGDIYLCSSSGAQTTTEVSLGSLAVTGTSLSQGNPLPPTTIASGTYSMTASAPSGYVFVTCGGSGVPDSSGVTASETVIVPSGGAGVGSFYVVVAAPTSSLGSGPPQGSGGNKAPSSSPGSSGPGAVANSHVTPTKVVATHLAFTGLNTFPLLLAGILTLALGGFATFVSRSRRGTMVEARADHRR